MKFARWFKIAWWIVLLVAAAVLLAPRYNAVMDGKASAFDTGAFGVLVGLLLVPLFSEVDFLGVKLKQQVDDLKKDVTKEIANLRNEIRAEFRNTINPVFNVTSAQPDTQLPNLKNEIEAAVKAAFAAKGEDIPTQDTSQTDVPAETMYLFQTRLSLETKLRSLWLRSLPPTTANQIEKGRSMSAGRIISELGLVQVLTQDLQNGIREVYAICSRAIHGDKTTGAQIEFVREVGPSLISALDLLLDQ